MSHQPSIRTRAAQCGSAAVEFALVALIMFTFVFGAMETARALYLWSTLAEVVSRAARLAAVNSPEAVDAVRKKAMFGDVLGKLPLGGDIDPSYLRIDYLTCDHVVISSPPSPIQNLVNCTSSPTDPQCVRYVQVRLCMPGSDCTNVQYKPMVGFGFLNGFNMALPTFSTVVAVDTLGLQHP